MQKFNSLRLLEERAQQFGPYLGKPESDGHSRIDFSGKDGRCSLSYKVKKSLMSRNYLLTLGGSLSSSGEESESASPEKGLCYLNRMGSWRSRGDNPVIKEICKSLKSSKSIQEQLKKTDLEAVYVEMAGEGCVNFNMELYGGGFSSVMLPPCGFL